MEKDNKVTSLTTKKKRNEERKRKQYLTVEQRVQELEADVARLVDISVAQEETIRQLEDRLWKLLRLFSGKPRSKLSPKR